MISNLVTLITYTLPDQHHCTKKLYRAFHRFGLTKFAHGGLVLGLSQFLILPEMPQKMTLASKVVKID